MTKLETLIRDYAGPAICSERPLRTISTATDSQWSLLLDALMIKNGFYAFESALHFFPLGSCDMDLLAWNEPSAWKFAYERQDLSRLSCFAENIFGEQYCLFEDKFVKFDPETGELETICESLEEWSSKILLEPNYYLGFEFAHAWQIKHGPLPSGMRLVPIKPFVCGGSFELDNLVAMEAVQSMRMRGSIATQIIDVPDGAPISFEIVK